MKTMAKLALALLLGGAVGCGGGDGPSDGTGGQPAGTGGYRVVTGTGGAGGGTGGQTASPTVHLIDANGGLRTLKAEQVQVVGPFTVPDGATVTYTITDMPTGIGVDTMNAGIATDATVQASNPTAYGVAAGVSSTEQTTPALPAGAYDLLVKCANLVDDCYFTDQVTATY